MNIVIPTALPGIVTGVMLAIARAAGVTPDDAQRDIAELDADGFVRRSPDLLRGGGIHLGEPDRPALEWSTLEFGDRPGIVVYRCAL